MTTSISAQSLAKLRKGRDEVVVIEGYHALKHALRFGAEVTDIVYAENFKELNLSESVRDDTVLKVITEKGLCKSNAEFKDLVPYEIPTGVIALAKKPETKTLHSEASKNETSVGQSVYLENVQNVSNLGAVIRVCAAYGIRKLYVSGQVQPWHAGVIRTGAGLSWALEIIVIASDSDIFAVADKAPVVACTDEGGSIYDAHIPQDAILCFGTEREGLTQSIRDGASLKIGLPMRSGVSSLNLATSVSAVLYAQGFKQ